MLSKNKITYIHSLKQKKYRDVQQRYIAEGHRLVKDLLLSEAKVECIYATKNWITENTLLINRFNIDITEVSEKQLKSISSLTTPNQVVSIIKMPKNKKISDISTVDYFLILDNISDPGNLGSIIRTADWFGVRNILCSSSCVDIYNSKTVQATMGSIARVHVFYDDIVAFLQKNKKLMNVYGACLEGKEIKKVCFNKPCAIIMGSESHGISSALMPYITEKVFIPQHNQTGKSKAESLNVSVSTAILLYEINKNQYHE